MMRQLSLQLLCEVLTMTRRILVGLAAASVIAVSGGVLSRLVTLGTVGHPDWSVDAFVVLR